jgi:hypothetical protein
MRDVAESGCGVVHIRAVEYAAGHGVPLVVRSSFHDGPGTVIGTVLVEPDEFGTAPLPAPTTVAATATATAAVGRESRYRPLVMNVVPRVTRIRLQTDDPGCAQAWRDLLLTHLDPVLTVTEWLDSGDGFRWEGLTRQASLDGLHQTLAATPDWQANGWQEDLTCISLTGGRPDSWLEVQRQLVELMARLGRDGWRMRADGSALRILVAGEVSPGLVQGLHQALLAP